MRIERVVLESIVNRGSLAFDLTGRGTGIAVLYGPNEAGKSTLLKLLLDLLFGGPIGTETAHLYDQKTRLEAWIGRGDRPPAHVVRKKSRQRLVFESGGPDEAEWTREYLDGYDRERFMLLFGFDHEGLRRGGANLIRSGGHAGISLFEAGGGIQHLSRLMDALSKESADLLAPDMRKNSQTAVWRAFRSYHDAKTALRRQSVKPAEWSEKRRAVERLDYELAALNRALAEKQAEERRMERALRVRGPMGELRRIRREMAAAGPGQFLTEENDHRISSLLDDAAKWAEAVRLAEAERETLKARSAGIDHDPVVLEAADEIQALTEELSRYESERLGRPAALEEVRRMTEEAEALLRRIQPGLTLEEAEALRVPLAVATEARELADRLRLVTEKLAGARGRHRDYLEARTELCRQQDRLGGLVDVGGLKLLLYEGLEAGRLEDLIIEHEQAARAKREDLDELLARQRYWRGDLESLAALSVPSTETVGRFVEEWSDREQRARELEHDRAQAIQDREQIEARLERIDLAGSVPVESDLTEARAWRERGWDLVKRAWLDGFSDPDEVRAFASDENLPRAYEDAVRIADDLADRMRREAERSSERAMALADRGRIDRRLKRLNADLEAAARERVEAEARWRAIWEPYGVAPGTPREMQEFLQAVWTPLAQGFRDWRELSLKRAELVERRAAWCRALVEMGTTLGAAWPEEAGPTALRALAESFLTEQEARARAHRDLRVQIENRDDQVYAAERETHELQAELEAIRTRWQNLRERHPSLPERLEEARTHLEAVFTLIERTDRIGDAKRSLHRSARVIESFEESVRRLASRIGPPADASPSPSAWVRSARERLEAARKAEQLHQELLARREENARRLAEAKAKNAVVEAGIEDACREHRCADRRDLAEFQVRSRTYRALDLKRADYERILGEIGDGLSVGQLEQETQDWEQGVGWDGLEMRVRLVKSEIAGLKEQGDAKREELAAKRAEFLRWDGSAADAAVLAEEADAHMAEVDRAWNQYLRVELARRMLGRAVEEFRDRNQSAVLERAGEIFRRLTLGRYEHVSAEYEDGGPYLRLEAVDGAIRRIEELSDGTRDQLFLSLRLAFHVLRRDRSESLPLIMDDILVHFDDQRTAAAFEVLADIARTTQILYFTHHEAVVEAASRTAGGSVSVHSMEDLVRP